jgi:hypothetical protein
MERDEIAEKLPKDMRKLLEEINARNKNAMIEFALPIDQMQRQTNVCIGNTTSCNDRACSPPPVHGNTYSCTEIECDPIVIASKQMGEMSASKDQD